MFLYHNRKFLVFILLASIRLYCPHETTFCKLLYKNNSVNNKNFEVIKVLLSYAKLDNKKKPSRVDRILSSICKDIKKQWQKILDSAPSNKIKVEQNKTRPNNLNGSKLNAEIHDSCKEKKPSLFKRIKLRFRKKDDKFARLKYLIEMSEKNKHKKKKNNKKKEKWKKISSKLKELHHKISYMHLVWSLIGLLGLIYSLMNK